MHRENDAIKSGENLAKNERKQMIETGHFNLEVSFCGLDWTIETNSLSGKGFFDGGTLMVGL